MRKLGLLFWLVASAPILIRELRRADAVHVPIPGDVGTLGMLLAFAFRKPLFVRHCGNWFVQRTAAEHFWKWFMERFAGGRNVMLATGGSAEPPSRRSQDVRWIFSTSLTEQELMRYALRREKPAGGRLRLITVGRQEKGKGTDVVIKSLPRVLRTFHDVTLDVVGDGAALNDLKSLASSLGVAARVKFHGKVDHTAVMALFERADLLCYPTASEGFPKVVLEALACGLPVVTTRVSVLPLLVNGGGLLIDEATPEAVASALEEIFAAEATYPAMSAHACETARQYSLERWGSTIGEMLRVQWGELQLHSGKVAKSNA